MEQPWVFPDRLDSEGVPLTAATLPTILDQYGVQQTCHRYGVSWHRLRTLRQQTGVPSWLSYARQREIMQWAQIQTEPWSLRDLCSVFPEVTHQALWTSCQALCTHGHLHGTGARLHRRYQVTTRAPLALESATTRVRCVFVWDDTAFPPEG